MPIWSERGEFATDNLIFSWNAVVPLFTLILLGMFLRKTGIIGEDFVAAGNRLTFNVFFPVMLFSNLYKTDLQAAYDPAAILFALCTIVGIAALGMLIVPLFEKSKARVGVIIQDLYRGNYLLFGIPLSRMLAGESAVALASSLMVFVVPLLNILAVFHLTYYNDTGRRLAISRLIISIVKNPLIGGVLAGISFSLLRIDLPVFLKTPVGDIASLANPFAFIMLGGQFVFGHSQKNIKPLAATLFARLFLVPALILTVAVVFFSFSGARLVLIFILVTSPCAVSSYQMACQFGADSEFACDMVVYSMLFSSVSLFFFVFLIKSLALI